MADTTNVVYDFTRDGAAYLNAVESGATIEITEGTFDYFLNVLPPAYMNRAMLIDGVTRRVTFGFAEGCEPIVAFWSTRRGDRTLYLCKRTTDVNRG